MTNQCKSISKIKLDIKQIVENIKLLESCEKSGKELKTNTEYLLGKLENFPLECLRRNIKIRQKRRLRKKSKTIKNVEIDKITETKVNTKPSSCSVTLNYSSKHQPKHHHQIRSIKECQRFLQTFELLQQLHLLRGQNPSKTFKFSIKLRKMKSIWNSFLQEKLQERIPPETKIQQQWDEVLFGHPEKTYFDKKVELGDFIRKRQIWDTYINKRFGSAIPIGWIMPIEKSNEKWRQYLAPFG